MTKQFYIYLISQVEHKGYDTFDSAVVVAESHAQARTIYPAIVDGGPVQFIPSMKYSGVPGYDLKLGYDDWATTPINVSAVKIGTADLKYTEPTIICASFNAG